MERLIEEADRESQQSLNLGGFKAPEINERSSNIQDIDEAHEEYYKNSHNPILKHIPKGELRYAILDLRKLYLREGKMIKDSRQACPIHRRRVEEVTLDWLEETGGKEPAVLLQAFIDLNQDAGYDIGKAL